MFCRSWANNVNPHYHTHHYIDPTLGNYLLTRVHVTVETEGIRGRRTLTAHNSATPHATYDASVNSAAKRALWSICHTHRQELQNTEYRHLPRRLSGIEETVVTLGGDDEDRLNTLTRVTAALNTDLENVTTKLDQTQERLLEAHERIAELESQLAGMPPPPPQMNEPRFAALSPPRKKLLYGAPGSITRLED
ncbi:uncharacterized protein C2845_PM01G43090 [Panicum miliaceum]|uniref:Uncharacterized protein n=1 Tax=Panicum miliaceum TaxID=4540 RepID=A0A3L6TJI6_PANMI|nr:uncharacterized protein C2845_PM01G43090 [Panicum miliaceum]